MSGVDWERMQPPTEPTPAPPVTGPTPPEADSSSWQPITTPAPAFPPSPPPPPPAAPPPSIPPPPAAPPPSFAPIPPAGAPPQTQTKSGGPSRGRRAVLVALVAALLVLGGYGLAHALDNGHGGNHSQSNAGASSNSSSSGAPAGKPKVDPSSTQEPIAAVAAAVSPSVVQIETNSGLGSGVIYTTDGYILTAAHVVDGAGKSVKVRLADGSLKDGNVVGSDDASDIAVVKIDGNNLEAASLATGVKVEVGQTAVAIGSPFGLEETVTAGIVSAVDRPQETPGGAIDMIQIDAPINPGNSGGPVADKQGRVFGIADSIITQTGDNAGVGFLVPIDLAKDVADKLVAGDPVEFAFLGVSTDPTTTSVVGDGAVIVDVTKDSPADKAGLQQGDKIVSIDSSPVRDPIELGARVRSHKPGDVVHVTFERDGNQQSVDVTLGSTKSK
jgi:putative serine protease PepD